MGTRSGASHDIRLRGSSTNSARFNPRIGAAYLIGTALQGIGDFVLKRGPIRRALDRAVPETPAVRNYALSLIRRRAGADFPSEARLHVCLTQVDTRRNIYDKFIALRDMARGLAVGTPVAGGLILWGRWDSIAGGTRWVAVVNVAGTVGTITALTLAFIQRYARFHPLAQQVVFGQFVAVDLFASRSDAAALQTPPSSSPSNEPISNGDK